MDAGTVVVLFVLFMVAIYCNHRLGYHQGINGGYFVGVHDTLELLIEKGHITATKNGQPVKTTELAVHFHNTLTDRHNAKKTQQVENI